MLDITPLPSPNFNERNPAIKLDYIVLHYTGMKSGQDALQRLCDPAAKVSAHYVIEEDGRIFQLVPDDKRAWHAGVGSWRGITDMNSASIGIELVNPGHEFGYRDFPDSQIANLMFLLKDIIRHHDMNPKTCLVGHSDIAPARKQDPGELFPWQRLAQSELGIWPKPSHDDFGIASSDEILLMLQTIGYEKTLDMKTSLLAFQRRYVPLHQTGIADRETTGRLRFLVRNQSFSS
jgi:N-acetylmuramoyl-L-alanine amidase